MNMFVKDKEEESYVQYVLCHVSFREQRQYKAIAARECFTCTGL